MESRRENHNRHQQQYYEGPVHARLALSDSRYVRSHIERVVQKAQLTTSNDILEVGCGPGKFTLPMTRAGYNITANDLSPHLIEELHRENETITSICCDIHDFTACSEQKFDAVIGFFVLHHLIDLPDVFNTLSSMVKPGGRVAFCEPVGVNPLYYLQILLTPGMHFTGEPSIGKMRKSYMLPAMKSAGFINVKADGYGYFPPFIKNSVVGDQLERAIEKIPFVPFPYAFQIFSATLPEC